MRITLPSGTSAEIARVPESDRGLVVVPDIGGLRPLFDDLVARLARETGWTTIVVEPFPGQETSLATLEARFAAMSEIDDDRLLGDLAAAADETGAGTVSVLGFCMGGMFTLKAAGSGRFHRAAPFYGMIHVPEDWQGRATADPLTSATGPNACPVLAIVGTEDPWTPPADVDALEAAGVTVVRYPGRDHGFVHDPDRPAHHAADADDAWRRVLGFLGED